MSFQDSAVIFFIALLLFGPKKLPELARQIGKLMGEFRRASNDFRMQMEDELRVSEQAERQKQIAAIAAAAPPAAGTEDNQFGGPVSHAAPDIEASHAELEPHPHASLSSPAPAAVPHGDDPPENSIASNGATPAPPDRYRHEAEPDESTPAAMAIATAGDLTMMPPATGVPVGRGRSGVAEVFESVPPASVASDSHSDHETAQHG